MSDSVKCPECDKAFKWKDKLAGKKVRCSGCDKVFRMPESEPGTPNDDDGGYELNVTGPRPTQETKATSAPQADRCPSCGNKIRAGAVLCINCGYNLKEGKQLKTEVGPAETPPDEKAGDDKDQ